jgi:hypothetical protein
MRGGILTKSVSYGQPSGKTLLVLMLLGLVVWAQSSKLASQPGRHHARDHCCLLFHLGPLPFLEPAITCAVTPVFVSGGLPATPDFNPAREVPLAATSSRAPPIA